MTAFADRLAARVARTGAPTCVGLDPVFDKLPAAVRAEHWEPVAAIRAFCHAVIRASADHAAAIKFQSACFERYGAPGFAAMRELISEAAGAGLAVVLDAKRGDIGISAEHYAAATASMGAHAITANAYLGLSTIEPYLAAGLGVFILVRTSNPDSDAVQSLKLSDGRTVAEMMADYASTLGEKHIANCGLSNVGAVVGATKAEDAAALRRRMPRQIFLVPGYGAQGGTKEDIRRMLAGRTATDGSILVTASRSVIYPGKAEDADWKAAIEAAASTFAADLRTL